MKWYKFVFKKKQSRTYTNNSNLLVLYITHIIGVLDIAPFLKSCCNYVLIFIFYYFRQTVKFKSYLENKASVMCDNTLIQLLVLA